VTSAQKGGVPRNSPQYRAILKKCGVGNLLGGLFGRRSRQRSPAFRLALSKYAACMRAHGVNLPEPNTSGNGPIFDLKGLDTTSAKYRTAQAQCRSNLRSTLSLGRGPGASAGRPGGGLLR
jgi:hypothetical protein